MKENDNEFIKSVVDYYYSTIDEEHPEGNMSLVADNFKVTRPKVNKILITAGVIDSPLHQDIMKLKGEGYNTDDIASALGVSSTTVKVNMPYEKVIYNGEMKSTGAQYVDAFRGREKVFLSKVVRKKTILEEARDEVLSVYENKVLLEKAMAELGPFLDEKREDDPIHLKPVFTEDEYKLFKLHSYVYVLNIELDADLSDVKKEARIKYGSTISRDIIIPKGMPLHNLHYALNEAFGFTHSHLHEFTLMDDDLNWLTLNDVTRWKKMLGLIFKNPYRNEWLDFWDDDYEGGSPKKWMRSKYTGPEYNRVYEESYRYVQEALKDEKFSSKPLDKLIFDVNHLALNEAVPIDDFLSIEGRRRYKSLEEYDELMKKSISFASNFPEDSILSTPGVYPFAEKLNYNYDFGDNWNFIITIHEDVEYLKGRVTRAEIKEAIKSVLTLARPRVIAVDGLPLIEDVGGVYGFKDFLRKEGLYADEEESLEWAEGNGWPGKIGSLKSIL